MTDRELLERAAKAYGFTHLWFGPDGPMQMKDGVATYPWNPLTDDGDALRLAVKLGLAIDIDLTEATSRAHHEQVMLGSVEEHRAHPTDARGNGDAQAATRRAIVRAASALGDAK